MEDTIASDTFVDGPYAFSLQFRQIKSSSRLNREGSNMAALKTPLSGHCAAEPTAAQPPSEPRKVRRDVVIGSPTGGVSFSSRSLHTHVKINSESAYRFPNVPVPPSVSHLPET